MKKTASRDLRAIVLKNHKAKLILLAIEKKAGRKIKFINTNEISTFDMNAFEIAVNPNENLLKVWLNGGTFSNRLLFHELGHAFLDVFIDKIDKNQFRAIFGKYSGYNVKKLEVMKAYFSDKEAVSAYGRVHGQEAFAEAFAHVVCNVDDSTYSHKVIRQLAFIDWMIECVTHSKRKWGKYRDYSLDIQCNECGEDFRLSPCRLDRDISNWEFDCPYCGEALAG